jgi:hypothetical protein
MKVPAILFVLLFAGLSSCNDGENTEKVMGLKPIYSSSEELATLITSVDPIPLRQVGKIYTKGNLLFINEVNTGVHVYDNNDATSPKKLKFIKVPGNIDIAMKGNYLYADMGTGLVTIDIADLDNVKVTSVDNNYVSEINQVQPPQSTLDLVNQRKVYFECADRTKGAIIAWELIEMPKPQCYINN